MGDFPDGVFAPACRNKWSRGKPIMGYADARLPALNVFSLGYSTRGGRPRVRNDFDDGFKAVLETIRTGQILTVILVSTM